MEHPWRLCGAYAMATEFRCDKCGKALWVDEPPGSSVVCPSCGSKVVVPGTPAQPDRAGGTRREQSPVRPPAAQTQPKSAPASATPPARGDTAQPAPAEEEAGGADDEGRLSDRTVRILAAGMPWGVSVVFHAGIFLVLLFLFLAHAIVEDPEAEQVIIPDARLSENPGGMIDPEQKSVDLKDSERRRQTKRHQYRKQPTRNMLADAATKEQSDLKIIGIGVGGGGGPSAYGLSAGEGDGPRASFYGSGGNAYKICYVIDRSGSLLDTFDYLREELKRSIRSLVPQQQFHVIFFSGGRPDEMTAKKLVHATDANKDKAFKYLDSIVPDGQTDPRPALEKAFRYKPELIYFMTDGDFDPDILQRLRRLNRDKKIKINTLSFVFKPGEELLRQIAEEHGGRYKHVSEDDLGQ